MIYSITDFQHVLMILNIHAKSKLNFKSPEELLTEKLILKVLKECNLNNLELLLIFYHFSMFCMKLKFQIKSVNVICNNQISNSQASF